MYKKSISFLALVILLMVSCNNSRNRTSGSTPEKSMKDYELVWADEFNSDKIDLSNWSFEIWDAGRVNNEWQQYVENYENYKLLDGKLYITATRTGNNEKGGYASTRLSSQDKQEFTYGRVEFNAKMPSGVGTWPALWMLGANIDEVGWPRCGEIDIMEYVGFQPDTTHSNVHTRYQSGATDFHGEIPLATAEEYFHVYGMTWTSNSINFYIDDPGNIVNTYSPGTKTEENWPFDKPFFIIMNFAVGGNWGGKNGVDGDIWPQSMVVDYVRLYKLKE
jgi:beta-glucanase (GH16 family)